MSTNPKHGGKRPNSGRPASPDGKAVSKSVSLPESLWQRLGPNRSKAIRELALKHTKP